MRWFNRLILMLLLALLSACAQATPTPTATVTSAPTLEPTAIATPAPTETPVRIPIVVSSKPAEHAYLRIVHAAPDAPAVDVYLEGLTLASNLTYTRYGDSAPVASGDYGLNVVAAGTGMDGKSLLSAGLSLKPGQTYTLLLTGSADQLAVKALIEIDEPLTAGQSRVALINAVDGIESLTVTRDGQPLIDRATNAASSEAVVTASGNAQLAFRQNATPLLERAVSLRERTSYTFVLVGQPQSPTLIRFETRIDGRAAVRVVHAAAVGSIAASLDDQTPLTTDTPYGHASDLMPLVAGKHTIDIYPASGDPNTKQPILSAEFTADPDSSITLILLGPADQLRLVVYNVNLTPTEPGKTRIAFINTQSDVPLARVTTSGNAPIPGLPDLGFGQLPAAVDVRAGRSSFTSFAVTDNALGAPLESAQNLDFETGIVYLYLLAQRALDAAPLILSDRVGIAVPTPTPVPVGAQVRFVNAVAFSQPLHLTVGGVEAGSGIGFGQAGDFADVPAGSQTATARIDGGVFASADLQLEPSARYTLFAYQVNSGPTLLLVSDDNVDFDGVNARIRFVNLSPQPDMSYGMGSTEAIPADKRPPEGTEEEVGRRLTLPMGVQRYVENIGGGSVSVPVSIQPASYDVFIIDQLRFGSARRLNDVQIEANRLYDVVAFQDMSTEVVTAFVVPYPPQGN